MTTTPPEAERVEELHPWWNKLEEALSKQDEYHFCKVDATDLKFALIHYRDFHQELQKAREEERERIEAIFKKYVPPHAMDLEDSVWLKRLLNKAFNHDKNI